MKDFTHHSKTNELIGGFLKRSGKSAKAMIKYIRINCITVEELVFRLVVFKLESGSIKSEKLLTADTAFE